MKPVTTLSSKDRILAVDIVRILAAFGVLLGHMPQYFTVEAGLPTTLMQVFYTSFGTISALFFVLAGFFACRNITWKKALNNAWWCFAPFALWSVLAWVNFAVMGREVPPIYTVTGLRFFLFPRISVFEDATLLNGTLWFMRDLVFLFLLSPLIFRFCRYIFPAAVVLSVIPDCSKYFTHDVYYVTMSLYSISFFAAGCFLASFSKPQRDRFLAYYSPLVIIGYLVVNSIIVYYFGWGHPGPFVRNLCGVWILYQIARWIEVLLPSCRNMVLKLAPVTFLTFAGQCIVCPWFGPLEGSYEIALIPFGVFALMTAFFYALKRWCRPLLHLVAHYKLRPDDMPAVMGDKEKAA